MVSVSIVNYYAAKLTTRAVSSVFEHAEDVEVIVVDNTSTTEERFELKKNILSQEDIEKMMKKMFLKTAKETKN